MSTLSNPTLATRANIAQLRFLVVDDFGTMRRIVTGLVKDLGVATVLEAEDGVDALAKFDNGTIDFIISDWNMPKMTGLDLLKAVRSSESLGKTPFLLITAEARKENILAAVQAGADGYIVKPFTAIVLGEKIKNILERRNES